ncbi:13454_t:CDS:2 [Cetraspora pellucida]|uniref:13454_t:CDS:1 n=1 Tax=Cetraspora pellucida TaxID=1433469 RepID=A0ACA9KLG2_9GLOM|nr:13454_t:CDS:2 [Cetraspora pellucida]
MFYEEEILSVPLAVKIKHEKLKEPDDSDPFDDKDLDEAEGFLTDQYSDVIAKETEKEEESIIEKLKKNLDNEALTND